MGRRTREQSLSGFLQEPWVGRAVPVNGVVFFNPTPGTETQSVQSGEVTTTLLMGTPTNSREEEIVFPAPLAERATRLRPGDRIAAVVDIHIQDSLDPNRQPQRTTRVEVQRFEQKPTPPLTAQ